MLGDAPASRCSPFGRALGEDLKPQHVWVGRQQGQVVYNCSEDHWFFTACAKPCLVTRGRLSARDSYGYRRATCFSLCMVNGSFSWLRFVLGFVPGELQSLLMFLACCDARWSQVSRVPGACGVNPAVRGVVGVVKLR